MHLAGSNQILGLGRATRSPGKLPTFLLLLIVPVLIAGCASPTTAPPAPSATRASTKASTPSIEPARTPTITATSAPPFFAEWNSSPHADAQAAAFHAWDGSATGKIPPTCAKCHSVYGFLDFLGADGSTPGVVDVSASVGSVIECEACHNLVAETTVSVTMPSGVELSGLGLNAACLACHQGRASGTELGYALKSLAPNGISASLGFVSVHNSPAGAMLFGSEVGGGFEYPGRVYASRFKHNLGDGICSDCHDPHSLHVRVEACGECHAGIIYPEDIESSLRISTVDYDGDGDMVEGLAGEVETLRVRLLAALQTYAEKTGSSIFFSAERDPFFFDASGNPYNHWTPILLEAAYNYHFVSKDPGAFAHNGRYSLQLLYDSIQAVGGDITGLVRP